MSDVCFNEVSALYSANIHISYMVWQGFPISVRLFKVSALLRCQLEGVDRVSTFNISSIVIFIVTTYIFRCLFVPLK